MDATRAAKIPDPDLGRRLEEAAAAAPCLTAASHGRAAMGQLSQIDIPSWVEVYRSVRVNEFRQTAGREG